MSAEDCTAYRVIDGSYYVIPLTFTFSPHFEGGSDADFIAEAWKVPDCFEGGQLDIIKRIGKCFVTEWGVQYAAEWRSEVPIVAPTEHLVFVLPDDIRMFLEGCLSDRDGYLWEVNELDDFFAVQSRVCCSCCGKKKTTAMIGKGISNAKVVAHREARKANGQNRRPELVIDTRPTGLGCRHIGDKFSGGGR